jgi:hypothetical protein
VGAIACIVFGVVFYFYLKQIFYLLFKEDNARASRAKEEKRKIIKEVRITPIICPECGEISSERRNLFCSNCRAKLPLGTNLEE